MNYCTEHRCRERKSLIRAFGPMTSRSPTAGLGGLDRGRDHLLWVRWGGESGAVDQLKADRLKEILKPHIQKYPFFKVYRKSDVDGKKHSVAGHELLHLFESGIIPKNYNPEDENQVLILPFSKDKAGIALSEPGQPKGGATEERAPAGPAASPPNAAAPADVACGSPPPSTPASGGGAPPVQRTDPALTLAMAPLAPSAAVASRGSDGSDSGVGPSTTKPEFGICEIPPRELEVKTSSRLGSGANGDVYKGRYKGKEVAVKACKRVSPTDRQLFINEFLVQSQMGLRSDRVVGIHGVISQYSTELENSTPIDEEFKASVKKGGGLLVMELMDGDLENLLNEEDLTVRQKLEVMQNICKALHDIHTVATTTEFQASNVTVPGYGVFHDDMKLENVTYKIIKRGPTEGELQLCIKLADFGKTIVGQSTPPERPPGWVPGTTASSSVVMPIPMPSVENTYGSTDMQAFATVCLNMLCHQRKLKLKKKEPGSAAGEQHRPLPVEGGLGQAVFATTLQVYNRGGILNVHAYGTARASQPAEDINIAIEKFIQEMQLQPATQWLPPVKTLLLACLSSARITAGVADTEFIDIMKNFDTWLENEVKEQARTCADTIKAGGDYKTQLQELASDRVEWPLKLDWLKAFAREVKQRVATNQPQSQTATASAGHSSSAELLSQTATASAGHSSSAAHSVTCVQLDDLSRIVRVRREALLLRKMFAAAEGRGQAQAQAQAAAGQPVAGAAVGQSAAGAAAGQPAAPPVLISYSRSVLKKLAQRWFGEDVISEKASGERTGDSDFKKLLELMRGAVVWKESGDYSETELRDFCAWLGPSSRAFQQARALFQTVPPPLRSVTVEPGRLGNVFFTANDAESVLASEKIAGTFVIRLSGKAWPNRDGGEIAVTFKGADGEIKHGYLQCIPPSKENIMNELRSLKSLKRALLDPDLRIEPYPQPAPVAPEPPRTPDYKIMPRRS